MLEVAHDHRLGHQPGRASILVFANHARMGVYADALALDPAAPDVTATESPGRVKYGASTNLEQALAPDLGVFARAGWNDGRTQTWAFTEIDRTVALGMSAEGSRWGLPGDRLGAAGIGNGLSRWHRDYLAAGGSGFILGDGRLDYAPERILEVYYAKALGRPAAVTLDCQRVWNPGCNRDRGPVDLFAVRVHAQF